MAAANGNNTAAIGFEQQIWAAADIEANVFFVPSSARLFTNIQMIEHGTDKDILGRTYEYCLAAIYAKQSSEKGYIKKTRGIYALRRL
jgi:hypothetical protein